RTDARRLTPLGEKLVWAGQRLRARLGPQLQNLAQELQTELTEILPQRATIVRVHASHGFAVSKLRELLSRAHDIGLDLRYVSNQNSLVSLAHDAYDLAGAHIPQGELRKEAVAATRPSPAVAPGLDSHRPRREALADEFPDQGTELGRPPACAGGSWDRIEAHRLTWTMVPPAPGPLMRAPSPLETTLTQSESLPL